MTYEHLPGSTAVRRSDGAIVPNDPGNMDWQDYLAWCAAGNVAAPASHGAAVTASELCVQIDSAADSARRAVVGDYSRAEEYRLAAAEAQAFKEAGYPLDAVPRTVAAAALDGLSAQDAADSILVEAAQYATALYRLREVRLEAKLAVRKSMAAGAFEQARSIATAAVASIQAAVAGVGNAPSTGQ